MNILFINPPTIDKRKITRNIDCASESKGNYLLQPFDFILLSGEFSRHGNVNYLDAVVNDYSLEDIQINIKELSPEIIVVAIIDLLWEVDFFALREIEKKNKDKKILVMGDAFVEDFNVEKVLPYVDGIIVSPLELDVKKVVTLKKDELSQEQFNISGFYHPKYYQESSNIKYKMKSIKIPRHDLFQHAGYKWPFARYKKYTTVITAWGCPYHCSYCITSRFSFVYRDYQEIIEELEYIKRLGIKEVYIGDKSFGLPKDNIEKLLMKMIENNYNISWSTYLNPLQFSERLFDLMKRTGCHTVIVGIESYNEDSLKEYNRKLDVDQIKRLVSYAQKIDLKICGDFLFGLNNETEVDIKKTIDFAVSLNLDYASFNIAAPLPGSKIRKEAILDGRMKKHDHHYDSFGGDQILPSKGLNAKQLIKLRNRAVRKFYLRPGFLLKHLSNMKSFEQLYLNTADFFLMFKKIFF